MVGRNQARLGTMWTEMGNNINVHDLENCFSSHTHTKCAYVILVEVSKVFTFITQVEL